jgi:hypothetical protein
MCILVTQFKNPKPLNVINIQLFRNYAFCILQLVVNLNSYLFAGLLETFYLSDVECKQDLSNTDLVIKWKPLNVITYNSVKVIKLTKINQVPKSYQYGSLCELDNRLLLSFGEFYQFLSVPK